MITRETHHWTEADRLDGSRLLEQGQDILQTREREVSEGQEETIDPQTDWSTFFEQLAGRFPTNTVRFSLIRSSALFLFFLRLPGRSSSSSSGRLRLTFFALVRPSSSAFCSALSLWTTRIHHDSCWSLSVCRVCECRSLTGPGASSPPPREALESGSVCGPDRDSWHQAPRRV